MLPCYVVGDLPPERMAAIEEVLAANADLGALVEELREQNERTIRALCGGGLPDALLDAWTEEEPPEVPIQRPARRERTTGRAALATAAIALMAAVALMAVLAWSLGPDTGPVASLPSITYAHQTAMSGHLQRLDPTDRPAVDQAFARAGVPDVARVVPDLSHIGLRAEAVYVIPGQPPGSASEYTDGTHHYLCQMWGGVGMPPQALATRTAGDHELRGYRADGVSFVMWVEGGMLCVMSAAVPLDDLLALVEREVTSTG